MSSVGYRGAEDVFSIGNPSGSLREEFNTSTPAGWAMIWWGLSIAIILFILWNL